MYMCIAAVQHCCYLQNPFHPVFQLVERIGATRLLGNEPLSNLLNNRLHTVSVCIYMYMYTHLYFSKRGASLSTFFFKQ